MPGPEFEREQEEAAAAEAGAIGGPTSSEGPPAEGSPEEAMRPIAEAGEGESEGFEEAERELIEHASHGDQHAARRVIEDAPREPDDPRASEDAEVDALRSTEREEDRP